MIHPDPSIPETTPPAADLARRVLELEYDLSQRADVQGQLDVAADMVAELTGKTRAEVNTEIAARLRVARGLPHRLDASNETIEP